MVEMIDAGTELVGHGHLPLPLRRRRRRVIADDDDSPDTNRSELVFVVEPGVALRGRRQQLGRQRRRSRSSLERGGRRYGDDDPVRRPRPRSRWPRSRSTIAVDADAEDEHDVPTFAELVALFDVVTDGLRALADHLGTEHLGHDRGGRRAPHDLDACRCAERRRFARTRGAPCTSAPPGPVPSGGRASSALGAARQFRGRRACRASAGTRPWARRRRSSRRADRP
jgi:hypothetical protein